MAVGIVKKSTAAVSPRWFAGNSATVWEGGFLRRIMYFVTVDSETS